MGPEAVETKSRESKEDRQSSSSSVAGYVEADGGNEERKESSGSTQQSAAKHALNNETNIFIVDGERSRSDSNQEQEIINAD